MNGLELKEFLLENGKLEWRAFNGKTIIEVKPNRVELVRALRKRFGL